jgi:hypothetical protein
MRKPVKEPSLLNMLNMEDNITIAASTSSRHDILVERKRNEDNDDQKIDNSANASHALRDLSLVMLAHVNSSQARLHKRRTQPSNHGIGGAERDAAEGKRSDEWLAIGLEVVDEDADAGCG